MRPSSRTYLSSSETSEKSATVMTASQALGNFFEHHFGGSAADRLDAGIACHSFDRAFADEADAAMELQAVIHHGVDEVAAIGLGHRHFAGDVVALRIAPGGSVDELPSGFDLGRTHGDALANGLLLPQRRAERLPRLEIVDGQIERSLRLAHRHRADHGAL